MKLYSKIIRSSRSSIAEATARLVYKTGWSSSCSNKNYQYQMVVVSQPNSILAQKNSR